MFLLVRTITYASLFIGFVLIYLPARLVARVGVTAPVVIGVQEVAGMVIGALGAVVALWCIATFALIGKGTPFPLDPPRRLVISGPYRFVRNPMYLGAALALAGAAVYYQSWALAAYAGAFLLAVHLFVVVHEERALRQTFAEEYETYCRHTRRWLPRCSSRA